MDLYLARENLSSNWARRSEAPRLMASCDSGSARAQSERRAVAGEGERSSTLSPRRKPCTAHSRSVRERPDPC